MLLKRILLAAVILTGLTSTASAQFVKVSFGVRGGGVATLNPATEHTAPSPYYSGEGGGFLGIKFGKVVGIQGECLYSLQGTTTIEKNQNYISNRHYLEIPVMLQLHAGRAVTFEAGYIFSNLLKSNLTGISGNVEDTFAANNFGSYFGGITFNLGKVFFLSFRYTRSIDSATYYGYGNQQTSTVRASLGIRFFNSKKSAFR